MAHLCKLLGESGGFVHHRGQPPMGLGAWYGRGQFGFFEDVSIFIHGAYPQIDAGYCTDARGVLRAIKASRAIVILLGIQLVFFSLLGFTLFGQPLPEFFGTPLKSLNTIFSVFTVENWAAAPEAASLLGQPWLYYGVNSFVILVLVIGGFISLSLANAIFVDEMASDNNDDVKAQLLLLKQDNQAMQTQLEEILFTLKSSKP